MACKCSKVSTKNDADRKTLRIALFLNALMFVVGMTAGVWAQSTGLMADALDMLADASSYAIASLAISRGAAFKRTSSRWSGALLLILGLGILIEVIRRGVGGSEPQGVIMMAFSLLSLCVNVTVLRMLGKFRDGDAHLRATWIFTRVDVIANVAVLISGAVVAVSGFRYIDLVVGLAIGAYVVKEALEIIREASGTVERESA